MCAHVDCVQTGDLSVTHRVATALLRMSQNKTAVESLARSSMSAVALCRALVQTIKDEAGKGKVEEAPGKDGLGLSRGQLLSRIAGCTAFVMSNLARAAYDVGLADAAASDAAAAAAARSAGSHSRQKAAATSAASSSGTEGRVGSAGASGSGSSEGDGGSGSGSGAAPVPSGPVAPSLGKYGLVGVAVQLAALAVKGGGAASVAGTDASNGSPSPLRSASPSSPRSVVAWMCGPKRDGGSAGFLPVCFAVRVLVLLLV